MIEIQLKYNVIDYTVAISASNHSIILVFGNFDFKKIWNFAMKSTGARYVNWCQQKGKAKINYIIKQTKN